MKPTFRAFAFLFLLTFWGTGSAQVRVEHRFVNDSAFEIFFLKDFDINSASVGPPIFFVDIINASPEPVRVTLTLELHSRKHGPLSRGETREFEVPGAPQVLTLSNKNLFSKSGLQRLVSYEVAEDIVNELLKNLLSTGKLPSDVYTFVVQVKDQNLALLDDDSFDIQVSNRQTLDIIGPGNVVSRRPGDCDVIFNNLPHFRWDTRMKFVRFILAEWNPGEDPEAALNEPRFTRIFAIGTDNNLNVQARDLGFNDPIEPLHSNSFQYPASDTRLPLQPGKVYVYRLIGLVNSSSGFFSDPSEVYCFKLAKLDQLGAGKQQFEFVLRNLLGSDYDKLFGEGGEFENYLPKRVTLDGKEVTFTEILTKMQELRKKYSGYSVE